MAVIPALVLNQQETIEWIVLSVEGGYKWCTAGLSSKFGAFKLVNKATEITMGMEHLYYKEVRAF